VPTSEFAHKGLGWPVEGPQDDGVRSSGLGWPETSSGSVPEVVRGLVSKSSAEEAPEPVSEVLQHELPRSSLESVPVVVLEPDSKSGAVQVPDPASVVELTSIPSSPPGSILGSASGVVLESLSKSADEPVPERVPVMAPEMDPAMAPEMVARSEGEPVPAVVPDPSAQPVPGVVQDSASEPRLRLDADHRLRLETDPMDATERGDLPTADAVSRETANQGGVENVSERDQLAASLPDPGSETPLAQAVAQDARRRISLTDKIFPRPDHTRILTVANQKGGVGKTTTTVNVAAALAQAGLRVLVIDIDPQGNASTALGIDHHADVPSIYDVLVDGKPVVDCVQECADIPNLWCVPATIDLAGAEIELVSLVARETRMEKALTAYIAGAAERDEERLDYVLIDCPPSLGLLTVNAFVAADEVFIPIQCEYYALEGLSQLLKNIELIKSHLNPGLHVSTILLTMYDGRTRLSAQVAEEVRTHFPDQVLRTSVPRSVRISEAPSFGQTVMTYDPTSSGALSYLEAASELAERGAAVEREDHGDTNGAMQASVGLVSPGEGT
jgi:chromosome partitioning protein